MHEFHARIWSLRYASAAQPRVANGLRFDRRLLVDRGDVVEGEVRYSLHEHPGAVRVLTYFNHTRSGDYAKAIAAGTATRIAPDITANRLPGTLKYGFGINLEQEITPDVGVFGRIGWNDGKTEDFAFTAIDRLFTAGISVAGSRWRRPMDTVASEFTASGLSNIHAQYLAKGGLDFIIGDGHLNYGQERIWESYYNARVIKNMAGSALYAGLDAQRIWNPAYNRDRGPLWAFSLRLHIEKAAGVAVPHR